MPKEGERAASRSVREQLWQRVAMGLQVHRYFLHVGPTLEGAPSAGSEQQVTGYREARLRETLSRLEQSNFLNLHSRVAADLPSSLLVFRHAGAKSQISQSELAQGGGELVAPSQADAERIAEAWDAVRTTCFGALAESAIAGVVLCNEDSIATSISSVNTALHDFAFIPLRADMTTTEVTDHLVAACATFYFIAFWHDAESTLANWRNSFSLSSLVNIAAQDHRVTVLCNGLVDSWRATWLTLECPARARDENYSRPQLERIKRRLNFFLPLFEEAVKTITAIPLYDLLATSYPSAQRFAKFEAGGGPGQ